MDFSKTVLLSQSEVIQLITLNEAIEAVEEVFKAYASGFIELSPIVHADVMSGEFHIKAGGYKQGPLPYFTTKVNGGFFSNAIDYGLPSVLGVIVLNHIENGFPLAVMDSSIITLLRTAAAMGVAAKYLAHPQSTIATICGCGKQALWQLRVLKAVFPLIDTIFVYSRNFDKSNEFSKSISEDLKINISAVDDLKTALKLSQICITCTPSKSFFIEKSMVPPGLFIAAMGADSPSKQEIDPLLFKDAKIVVDVLEQCCTSGDLHHALNLLDHDKECISLGDVVSGKNCGQKNPEEIVIFDSTGTAMQDTALARLAYEKAISNNQGNYFRFF